MFAVLNFCALASILVGLSYATKYIHGNCNGTDINMGVLLPWTGSWQAGKQTGSAVILAIKKVEQLGLLPGRKITFKWGDDQCLASKSVHVALKLWEEFNHCLHVLIGPTCSDGCSPVSLVASYYNIPVISWGCSSPLLSNTALHPTFSRSVSPYTKIAPMLKEFFDLNKWKHAAFISDSSEILHTISTAVKVKLTEYNITVSMYLFRTGAGVGKDLLDGIMKSQKDALWSAVEGARIILLMAKDPDLRHIMLEAQGLGLTNGDYTFINLFGTSDNIFSGSNAWLNDPHRDAEAKQAFQGLLNVNIREPMNDKYTTFKKKVREGMEDPRFNHTLNDTDKVNNYAGPLHDAVLMYAYALNKTLTRGDDEYNGTSITENTYNQEFEGISGVVKIDNQGDRDGDFSINIVQGDKFVYVGNYFAFNNSYVILTDNVTYMGDRSTLPPDGPECGWRGEKCKTFEDKVDVIPIVGGSMAGAIVIVIIVMVILYRRVKYEAELKQIEAWKVDWSELRHDRENMTADLHSQASIRSRASRTSSLAGKRQVFAITAWFKDLIVAVKELNRPTSVSLTRQLLVEVKQMRDLNHDNINPFVGAALEYPHVCILMLYCGRGSLLDVLENDNVKLTWDFKVSFATDICKGMQYLHDKLGPHGRLKSTNVVIDGRWICRITDYGAKQIRDNSIDQRSSEKRHFDLLWTAPEMLCSMEEFNTVFALYGFRADVYSFGIILSELVVESHPFSYNEPQLKSEDTINLIRKKNMPPYRPAVIVDSCSDNYLHLMETCWNEDPNLRPPFKDVRHLLKNLTGGKTLNIMDNMIKMLEQHSNHLEELVTDRTKELDDEKKKTDMLLYSILPRSCAEQLKKGLSVSPEYFDCVTIYFSDIVSFTKIAAASTPIQVVDMLNTLYTLFDSIIDKHDVYKVETIGDAYMCISGLPERTNRHACEVANMSLDILSSINSYQIPHFPGQFLQLRIGIHSGPAVAGVVGLKMPRYCIFGDTVNMASRMESNGYALRIHMSLDTQKLLDSSYHVECRGEINIKGKGSRITFWLNGRNDFEGILPSFTNAASLEEHEFK